MVAALAWVGGAVLMSAAPAMPFHLPEGAAAENLGAFSRLSGLEIIFQVEDLNGRQTRSLSGNYEPVVALALMLRGTGLEAVKDSQSDAFVVRRITPGNPLTEADGAGRRSWPGDAGLVREPARPRLPGSDVLEMSPFEVRSRGDAGYRASNAISATRMAIPARELPMAVTSFTREFIEDQHAYDLYDIVKWAPGVHQDNVSPQGWIRYNVRGFTSAAVQRNGFGSYRFIDPTNIERVEVVKGPSSLLYGQINPGGVINYITKRPQRLPRTTLDLAAGSQGYARAVLDATGPVPGSEGRLLGRLILMNESLPQFQQDASGEKRLLAPSLTWRLSEHTAFTLDYEHFERLDDMPTSGVILRYRDWLPGLPYEPLPRNFSYAGEGDFQDFISDALTLEFTTRFGDHTDLRATYLDSTWDMEWRATGQGGTGLIKQVYIDNFYPPEAGLTPADAMYRRNRWEHQWGGERTAQVDFVSHFHPGGFDLRLLVGVKRNLASYQHSLQRNNPNSASSPHYLKPWDLRDPATWDRRVPFGLEALVPAADTEVSSDASSLYGVVTAATPDGRLRVLGGYARHHLHNAPTIDHLQQSATPRSDRSADVPQVGVSYEVTPGFSAFASYSESFLANSNMLRIDNVPALAAEPSVGRGLEGGLKFTLADGRFSGSVSYYRIHANPSDIITVTSGVGPDGTTTFSDLQGGSQTSRGVELELLFTPRDDLQVMAAFSQCEAVYQEHPTNPAFNGAPLVGTPDRTFSVWTKFAPVTGPLRGARFTGGVNYVGEFSHVGNNPLVQLPDYATVDLAAGYGLRLGGRPCDVELMVKNVFNDRYYVSASSWGFPRQVLLSLRLGF